MYTDIHLGTNFRSRDLNTTKLKFKTETGTEH